MNPLVSENSSLNTTTIQVWSRRLGQLSPLLITIMVWQIHQHFGKMTVEQLKRLAKETPILEVMENVLKVIPSGEFSTETRCIQRLTKSRSQVKSGPLTHGIMSHLLSI
jgi:hypothetical protein